jgi:hypothetical protein
MVIKDQYPPNLKDILKKYQLDSNSALGKDLYGDMIKKNPFPDSYFSKKLDNMYSIYNPSGMKQKKHIFKDTAVVQGDLQAKLRAKAGERLPVDVSGGFAVGQLVHVSNMGHGVILGFYRHHDFPYTPDNSPSISEREDVGKDGGSIRAEVLINGDFHRLPLPNLSAPTVGTS